MPSLFHQALAFLARGLCICCVLPPHPEGALPCPMSRFQAQCQPTGWPFPLPLYSLSQHCIVSLRAMDHSLYSPYVSVGDDLVNVSPSSGACELHQGRGHVFLIPFCVHRAENGVWEQRCPMSAWWTLTDGTALRRQVWAGTVPWASSVGRW